MQDRPGGARRKKDDAMIEEQKPADAIRAALKARGITRRQVAVVHEHYSMGSTIHVTVKDPAVRLSAVKEIAKMYENVARDSYSGEFLSAGNRFVNVEYAPAALAPIVAELLPTIEALPADGTVVELRGGAYRAFRDPQDGRMFAIVNADGPDIYCCGAEFAARQLAERIVDPPVGVLAV